MRKAYENVGTKQTDRNLMTVQTALSCSFSHTKAQGLKVLSNGEVDIRTTGRPVSFHPHTLSIFLNTTAQDPKKKPFWCCANFCGTLLALLAGVGGGWQPDEEDRCLRAPRPPASTCGTSRAPTRQPAAAPTRKKDPFINNPI